MNWTTADVIAHYKRLGADNPVQDACGDGRRKYRNKKTVVDGITFDSAAESAAYSTLRALQGIGLISKLELQPRFPIHDGFHDTNGRFYRAVSYRADFQFIRDGKTVVVEVKGFETATWRLKEKLFRAKYPDITLEVWK